MLDHRGPDNNGVAHHHIGELFVSLAHNRLSIIDLTDSANQPFFNKEKDAYVVYNGEIYNYIELRQDLASAGVRFRTTSDTEVLLEALLHWGVEPTLARLNGMWAFAFCDLARSRIVFARDRFGIKPFYYYVDKAGFAFGSEIKLILALTKRKFALHKETVARYVSQSLLDSDLEATFFEGIAKLPAGCYAELDLKNRNLELKTKRYYQVTPKGIDCTIDEAAAHVAELLRDSIAMQLRSDVRVGVLLSGGIDSSAIACIAQEHVRATGGADVGLLSLTSAGSPYDESAYARKVEDHIGCVGEKFDVGDDAVKFLGALSDVVWCNDEPVSSFSKVAYYQMMARAKELGIKVLLTGQGADEIFCGYKKYLGFYLQSLAREKHLLGLGREVAKFAFHGGFAHDIQLSEIKRYLAPSEGNSVLGSALHDYEPLSLTLDNHSLAERQVLDIERTSIPALLHYEDRLSMAFSREVRVPFLDHRVVEFALSCRDEYRIGSGWTKYVLRKAIEDIAPKEIVWRRDKNGFAVPQITWLKLGLRPHVERIFEDDCLMYDKGLVDKESLHEVYSAFSHSLFDTVSYKHVFAALALEVWLRRFAPFIA
jgi:asparagine synthase (glutamine-hydrolysing)